MVEILLRSVGSKALEQMERHSHEIQGFLSGFLLSSFSVSVFFIDLDL